MGSLENALLTGFICRLCSRMNKVVIHIFGEEGEKMDLAKKIDLYLPINVNVNDPLPKTVCLRCIEKLEIQHKLVEMSKRSELRHKELREKMKQSKMTQIQEHT